MKIPTKSNMYLDAKLIGLAPYAHAIDGDVDADCCVVSYGEASEAVRTAMAGACRGLGFDAPVFADLSLLSSSKDAFALVEGLDSLAVIVCDELAASMLGQAYRTQLPLNTATTLLGRPVVAFASFEEDLARPDMKQRDWACMKQLRK